MPKIQFTTNIPVELRLQSTEGEVTPSQFGGNQIKFSAHEGPFWVSEAVGSILADQIRKKRIQPHVSISRSISSAVGCFRKADWAGLRDRTGTARSLFSSARYSGRTLGPASQVQRTQPAAVSRTP